MVVSSKLLSVHPGGCADLNDIEGHSMVLRLLTLNVVFRAVGVSAEHLGMPVPRHLIKEIT
jgi:hypothetical protein